MALLDFVDAPRGGRLRLLPEWQTQPRITPTTIIDHSIVGSAEGAWQMFAKTSVLESHFIVDLDGTIWQLMDTDRQADANLHANGYALSIETADRGNPDLQPWTPDQLTSLIWLHEELVLLHPQIPRRKSRSCADPAGLGYHTLHGAPSCWTPVSKTCPGRARIPQWTNTLLPAFLAGEGLEADMTVDELAAYLKSAEGKKTLRAALWGGVGDEIPSVEGTVNAAQTVEVAARGVRTNALTLKGLENDHGQLKAQVALIQQSVDNLVLGHVSGDVMVTGALHLESPPPEPPA